MREPKTQVGTQWGSWTVIMELPHHTAPSGHRRGRVRVRCSCGDETEILSATLVKGSSTRCRKCARRKLKKGDHFGDLTVIEYVQKPQRTMVRCRCLCGGTVLIRPSLLKKNATNNCGCQPRGGWSGTGQISTTLLNRIRRRASLKGIPFDLTTKMLWELFCVQKGKCAISGWALQFGQKTRDPSTASLDRIDPSKGYVAENVQWTHKHFNRMKSDHSVEEFIALCRAVVLTADTDQTK